MNKLIALLVVVGLSLIGAPRLAGYFGPSGVPDVPLGAFPETTEPFPEMAPETIVLSPTTTARPTTTVAPTSTTLAMTTTLVPVDGDEVEFPIIQRLPHETPRWSIDYHIEGRNRLVLTVTLMTLVNRADQVDERRAQLARHKAEALAWLMEVTGTQAKTYPITWLPAEAASL